MAVFAKEVAQNWEFVNPEGIVKIEPMKINPHPRSIEGKTVVFRANGKHNSDNFLNRVGELLTQKIKNVKIIKLREVVPESNTYSLKSEDIKRITELKPDIIIGPQAD